MVIAIQTCLMLRCYGGSPYFITLAMIYWRQLVGCTVQVFVSLSQPHGLDALSPFQLFQLKPFHPFHQSNVADMFIIVSQIYLQSSPSHHGIFSCFSFFSFTFHQLRLADLLIIAGWICQVLFNVQGVPKVTPPL